MYTLEIFGTLLSAPLAPAVPYDGRRRPLPFGCLFGCSGAFSPSVVRSGTFSPSVACSGACSPSVVCSGACNRIGSISQSCRRMRQMSRLYGDEYRLKQLLSIHIAL